MSGNPKPNPEQNNYNPPPDPVDSMTGALKFVLLANLSATIVAKGKTVEDPTMEIWLPSRAIV